MCLFTRFMPGETGASPVTRTRMSAPHNLVRNHSLHFRRIRIAYQNAAAKPAFALFVLRSQDVPQKCVRPLYFSSRGFLEALSGAFVCF
ncbi:MAG: hypothetical protein JWN74_2771 [Acidobacteriaceae bacterium]|nr:hypothetical protein [Acidobacteriaceae bacterium]